MIGREEKKVEIKRGEKIEIRNYGHGGSSIASHNYDFMVSPDMWHIGVGASKNYTGKVRSKFLFDILIITELKLGLFVCVDRFSYWKRKIT